MLGTFQQSHIRIEIEATEITIRDSLLNTNKLRQWLFPQALSQGIPDKLSAGVTFSTCIGLITIQHQVQIATDNCLRMLLSQGIDGYHEWYWGDGWIQSRLEGISLLPLNLGQTFSLLKLREFIVNNG